VFAGGLKLDGEFLDRTPFFLLHLLGVAIVGLWLVNSDNTTGNGISIDVVN